MVSPATSHFQQATRGTLANKSTLLHQCDGSPVFRLNVGFQTVEFELPKRATQHEKHPLVHESLAGVGDESVIAERRAVKCPANDVVDVDDANQAARTAMDHEMS